MKPLFSIRFPMVREKTGNRNGPRYRSVVSTEGLQGARSCAAHMVSIAQMKRRAWLRSVEALATARRWGKQDLAWLQLCVELNAHSVRESALWARRFARGIADTDPRWPEIEAQGKALRARLDDHCQRHNAIAA